MLDAADSSCGLVDPSTTRSLRRNENTFYIRHVSSDAAKDLVEGQALDRMGQPEEQA